MESKEIPFSKYRTKFTTDEGSVVQKALKDGRVTARDNIPLVCAAHKFQTIIWNALNYSKLFKGQLAWDDMPEFPSCFFTIIQDCNVSFNFYVNSV